MNKWSSILVGAACLGSASAAFALGPTEYDNGVGVNRESYLSGATAQDNFILSLLRIPTATPGVSELCQNGSLDVFRANVPNIDGSGGTVAVRTYFCRAASIVGTTIAVGDEIVMHKAGDGSAKAFTPFGAAGDTRRFLNMTWVKNNAATRCTSAAVTTPAALNAYTDWNCGTLLAADVTAGAVTDTNPVGGVSDVDGAALVDPEASDAVVANVVQTPVNGVVFGVATSLNFRNALQTIQGLVGSGVPAADASRNGEAVMPSLTTEQLRMLFSSSSLTKTTIGAYFSDSLGASANASSFLGGNTPAPSTTTMYLCRRGSNSGTQASFATHYLGEGCVQGASSFVGSGTPTSYAIGANSAARIIAGTGSGDVANCLTDRNNNGRWAVGILSTESEGIAAPQNYRFVKVDGAAPTLLNVVEGKYPHFAEAVVTWGGPGSSHPLSTFTSDDQDIVNYLAGNLGQTAVIAAVNLAFNSTGTGATNHPWGNSGSLGLAPTTAGAITALVTAQGANPDASDVAATPVNRATRGGKNCLVPQLTVTTPLAN